MKNYVLLCLLGLVIYRVGDYVAWDKHKFISMLDNKREERVGGHQEHSDFCSHNNINRFNVFGASLYCKFVAWSWGFKDKASSGVQRFLPSPHSELVMGMVLGENKFNLVPTYNDVLKKSGLVHVVVVSGYNISLVFTLLIGILGSHYKFKNLLIGLFSTFLYAGISGFGIPAIRAWIMGSLAAIFRFYGRPYQGVKVLIFSCMFMLLLSPSQMFSISFLLSFAATLGVTIIPPIIESLFNLVGIKSLPSFLEDFVSSLSAQIMVNPILSYYFGSLSAVSLISNPVVLWVVPVCTILGGALVVFVSLPCFISIFAGRAVSFVLYPFLDFFVNLSEFFSNFSFATVEIRFSSLFLLVYYFLVFILIKFFAKMNKSNNFYIVSKIKSSK